MRGHRWFVSLTSLAIVLCLCAGAQAAEPADARAFVVWLFSHYPQRANSVFDPSGRSSGAVFDAPMIALFKENNRLTPKGDEGSIDSDLICDCQDDTGLVVKRMSIAPKDALNATASIDLVFAGGDKSSERFDLVLVGGHWRIHDIHTKDTPSLRAYMIDSNRELAKDTK